MSLKSYALDGVQDGDLLCVAINQRDIGGEQRVALVRQLLDDGADPNVTASNSCEQLPLFALLVQHTTYGECAHLLQVLLDAGADPWLFDAAGQPLTRVLQYGVYYSFCKNGVTLKAHRLNVYQAGLALRPILEKAMAVWTPELHGRFPDAFDDIATTVMLLSVRDPSLCLPKNVLYMIIALVAADYAAGTHQWAPLDTRVNLRKLKLCQLRIMCKERGLMANWIPLRSGKDKFIDILLGSNEARRKRSKRGKRK